MRPHRSAKSAPSPHARITFPSHLVFVSVRSSFKSPPFTDSEPRPNRDYSGSFFSTDICHFFHSTAPLCAHPYLCHLLSSTISVITCSLPLSAPLKNMLR